MPSHLAPVGPRLSLNKTGFIIALAGSLVTACAPPPKDPITPAPEKPTPALVELGVPSRQLAKAELDIYAWLDAGVATMETDLSYALGDGYPEALTLTPGQTVYVVNGCTLTIGTASWSNLTAVQGTAATLTLAANALSIDLREEGVVTAVLEGQLTGVSCMVEGNSVTSLPLRQAVTMRVRRVASFVVESLHQTRIGCEQKVVLPSAGTLWLPTVHPVDSAGERFEATNAEVPVAMTLRSTGGLSRVGEYALEATQGHVDVSLDTTKPVQGLKDFEVVDPEALTTVQAALFLRKATAKGSVTEEIAEGGSHQLYFPDRENLVELQVEQAATHLGTLCATLPASWLSAVSTTPGQCVPASGEQFGSGLPVVAILGLGRCEVEVTIAHTPHRWAAAFTTR